MESQSNVISTYHPVEDGTVEIRREQKHYMPKGFEYIIIFQSTLETVLTYDLSKVELKVFVFILSQVGFDNKLVMPGLQSLCATRTTSHQPDVSKALQKLEALKIIIKENITDTKSFGYRINYGLVAKTKGSNIKTRFDEDRKSNLIQTNLFSKATDPQDMARLNQLLKDGQEIIDSFYGLK